GDAAPRPPSRCGSSRYAHLKSDLDVLNTAFRGVPPRLTPAPWYHYTDRFWVASVAMAAVVTLIVALQWLRRPAGTELAQVGGAPSATVHSRDVGAISAYAEEVSAAMFDTAADQHLSSGVFDV